MFKTLKSIFGNSNEQSVTMRNNNLCPSCGNIFPKPPKRKIKCSKCKNECFVRTTQNLFNSDLLTEEDALAADFFRELQYLGATIDDYRNVDAELSKKWGTKAKSYDVVWGISNRLVVRPPINGSGIMHNAKMIAFAQALYQLQRGFDPTTYIRNIRSYETKQPSETNAKYIVETSSCCPECAKHQGEMYTSEEISTTFPLPIKECKNKLKQSDKYTWCTCFYTEKQS